MAQGLTDLFNDPQVVSWLIGALLILVLAYLQRRSSTGPAEPTPEHPIGVFADEVLDDGDDTKAPPATAAPAAAPATAPAAAPSAAPSATAAPCYTTSLLRPPIAPEDQQAPRASPSY